jgi:hypothetical protein
VIDSGQYIHCMDIPHFINSAFDGYLTCFQFEAIMDNNAMNISVHDFVWKYIYISLEHISKSKVTGSHNKVTYNILRNSQTVFQCAPFYILTSNDRVFHFLHIYVNVWCCQLLKF